MNTERTTRAEGFTLIELMIVIVVFGIVAAVALPTIGNILPNYRLKSAARNLSSYMKKARSEAVKRNTNVGIEFDTDGNKYTVFLDDGTGGGTAGDADLHDDEPILFEVEMPRGCMLYQASFGTGATTTTGYNYKGLPLNNLTGFVRMRNDKARWYQMRLSSTGHPNTQISSDGNF